MQLYLHAMKLVVALAAAALAACGNSKPAVSPPAEAHASVDSSPKPVSSNVAVGADILAACKIDFSNTTQAPKFDFASSSLLPDDTHVLEQVSTCLTTGPLKGRRVELVGRADPRGTEQYNLALGEHRAHEVTDYLHEHGVARSRIRETSRGALDSTGRDEDGWRTDRRVDLVLGS
jgi:outer membrane protein OmpA-like peptidoglycan-associated protein